MVHRRRVSQIVVFIIGVSSLGMSHGAQASWRESLLNNKGRYIISALALSAVLYAGYKCWHKLIAQPNSGDSNTSHGYIKPHRYTLRQFTLFPHYFVKPGMLSGIKQESQYDIFENEPGKEAAFNFYPKGRRNNGNKVAFVSVENQDELCVYTCEDWLAYLVDNRNTPERIVEGRGTDVNYRHKLSTDSSYRLILMTRSVEKYNKELVAQISLNTDFSTWNAALATAEALGKRLVDSGQASYAQRVKDDCDEVMAFVLDIHPGRNWR